MVTPLFSNTSNPITAAMATLSTSGLETLLNGVGAKSPIPSFPSADVQNSPMDIYLSYLAEILVQLTKCEPQVAYDSILWPDDLCDLVVVAPRLRLKDVNPNELAVELSKKVS
jgi:arginyl-tRNA synthetase